MASHCHYSISKSPDHLQRQQKLLRVLQKKKKKDSQETTIRTPQISHAQEIKVQLHSQ